MIALLLLNGCGSGDHSGSTTDSSAGPVGSESVAGERMNILLITSDDLGMQLSSYGDTVQETPNLDSLAASGVQFDVAYVAQASCSPSRGAIFTGMYPHRNGQIGLNSSGASLHPEFERETIPNILKRSGYRTAVVGKTHVNPDSSFEWDRRSRIDPRGVSQIAEFAQEVISSESTKPFFLMVNYTDPHAYNKGAEVVGGRNEWVFLDQHQGVPAELLPPSAATLFPFQGVDSPAQRARVASYYNSVKRVDLGIGMLLDVLENSGHADNTLVIFVGDHGPPFGRAKTTVYEAGLRVPFLVRWPGVSAPAHSSAMVSTVDILPTILDATGIAAEVSPQGRSLRPVLDNPQAPWRQYLAAEYHMHGQPFFPQRAIRDRRYKLIHNLLPGSAQHYLAIDGDIGYRISREARYKGTPARRAFDMLADPPAMQLYDLETDPWEFDNLAGRADYRGVQERLMSALQQWREETEDPFLDPVFLEHARVVIGQRSGPVSAIFEGR